MDGGWTPDLLGRGFEQRTLALPDEDGVPADAGGRAAGGGTPGLVATLVRRRPRPVDAIIGPLRDVDVLAVHGWSDYFFQVEHAEFWARLGARFFALDLRRYGRSIRPGQVRGDIGSLRDYDADIAAALDVIRGGRGRGAARRLVLVGHSTGGLVLSLWSARHPGEASAIVLNSPWLEFQAGHAGRVAIAPLVQARARVNPLGAHPEVDLGFYTRAQREIGSLPAGDERAQWRPDRGFPTHARWLAAVLAGHATVAAGIEVGCPALVLLSSRSTSPFSWSETMTSSDSVLVVDDIARAATRLGRSVTIARIDGAIHDVLLSRPEPRAQAYLALRRWLLEPGPLRRPGAPAAA